MYVDESQQLWAQFEMTGSVGDYLRYRQAKERTGEVEDGLYTDVRDRDPRSAGG
ncbi:hypothetical protein [Bittarella massiliensis (ex Durand et al. 2017)]|uniref:hypothetical protein n=1 Tax=Bittarella massiliensis (ex Durand et al. 2017) TaxID=1720313 RepID=UPI001AA10D5A|nr:hypothetical protein [Bittarella massiliensis (ex Durand et al. 2017)]MBO1678493.1 hypothetical protein [Bittarella massiliensis (ex Durand et al. 2017)]